MARPRKEPRVALLLRELRPISAKPTTYAPASPIIHESMSAFFLPALQLARTPVLQPA